VKSATHISRELTMLRRRCIQQRGKIQIHRLAHANPKMRGFDHRKPGKRRLGLGDAPAPGCPATFWNADFSPLLSSGFSGLGAAD